MKTLSADDIKARMTNLVKQCLVVPDHAVTARLKALEDAPQAVAAARLIAENNDVAEKTGAYCCQDTGQALFLVRLGDGVCCEGLHNALVEATRSAYAEARKSVADPLTRINSGDNTPPIIEIEYVSGDALEISFLAKGAGSENMTKLYMLTPADGHDGIVRAAVDAVRSGGANACPPLVVGIGVGGLSETACMLSKRALLRPLGSHNPRADAAALEREILTEINKLGIGVAGFGGATTALAVNVEVAPTHIGMLPIAVNLQCHSLRHGTVKF